MNYPGSGQAVAMPALDLLDVATQLLRDELLEQLPVERRHGARMISHALGIVGRELAMTWHLLEVERQELARFVALPLSGTADLPLDGTVLGLRTQLAAGLRRGEFDLQEAEMLQALRSLLRLRCSIDAPRALS